MRTDGGEKTGQGARIGKRRNSLNDTLIDQIVEVNIEDINLMDPHRTSEISALTSFSVHDNTHG